MREVFIHDIDESLVLSRRLIVTPIKDVGWVATTSRYILLKFFYFTACLGAVILSFYKGKLLFHFITILDALILKIVVSCKAKAVCFLNVVFYVSHSVMIEKVIIHISDVLPC